MTVNTYFIYPFCMMLHSFNSLWLDSWEKAFVCLPRVVAPSVWWRVRREGRAAPPRGAQERALWERAPARGQGRRASGAEGSNQSRWRRPLCLAPHRHPARLHRKRDSSQRSRRDCTQFDAAQESTERLLGWERDGKKGPLPPAKTWGPGRKQWTNTIYFSPVILMFFYFRALSARRNLALEREGTQQHFWGAIKGAVQVTKYATKGLIDARPRTSPHFQQILAYLSYEKWLEEWQDYAYLGKTTVLHQQISLCESIE